MTTQRSESIQISVMDPRTRPSVVGFMAALQEHERALSDDRVPGSMMADAHLAYLEAQCRTFDGLVLVASSGGVPCGFAVGFTGAYDDDDRHVAEAFKRYGEITDLYVAPAFRQQGVARALLEALEAHFRGLGLLRVRLSVLHGNRAAREAYEALGYRPADVVYGKGL